ncbi:DUF11 domain-containing protein [Spirosoma sp. KUDC1026]|nr:DUF11 domain-containing protein [Spirosoma sp. KUDC1026]
MLPALQGFCAFWAVLLTGLVTSAQAQDMQTIDLSLRQSISNQSPAIGNAVAYTLVVANAPGSVAATNVVVKTDLPAGGVTYIPGSANILRGGGSYNDATGTWTINSIAPLDSAVLVISATVQERGVWFSKAEIIGAGQQDFDSTPNNQHLLEDDYSSVCFSVPLLWYPGDEYTITIPTGYNQIVWYRNETPISTTAVSADLAQVNSDFSLTIKSPGTYRFVMYMDGCPVSNCCNIQVDAAPVSSVGDKVFADLNRDGLQQTSEPGISGVSVSLLDGTGQVVATTTTNASGIYSFTSLTPGVPYSVSFATPTGYVSTSALVGTDRTIDSDADPITGRTASFTLAPGENNTTIDAGFYVPSASLGDFVFYDNNGNGVQDGGTETGVSGIRVSLYIDGQATPVTSQLTDSNGKYLFTNLTPGTGYYVVFDTTGLGARNLKLTLAGQGIDGTNSVADPVTGRTPVYVLSPGEVRLTVDAGLAPRCPTNFNLIVSSNTTVCVGGTAQLIASTSAPGASIRWYLSATGGTAIDTVASGAPFTVVPVATTTYYAEAVSADGCASTRLPVTVTVTDLAAPVIAGTAQNVCPATSVNLTTVQITNQLPGLTYEWYTSINRAPGTQVTNLTSVGTGNYYLFARSADCYSDPTVLSVNIIDCNCQNVAGVTVGPGVAVCAGDIIPLRAILSGSATSVTWSTNGSGTFGSATALETIYTPSAADLVAGSVLLTATTNNPGGNCTASSSSLVARINPRPVPPVGVACDDTLVCQGSSTKLIGFAPGARINWYDQNNQLIATTESGEKLLVTPAGIGAVVYSAEAINADNCVSSRTSLTITVGQCRADLAVAKRVVTPGPYALGQKVTYAITASNNGPITGTNVTVRDVLPATLTYVSSTPVGEYNPATGIWTVGALTSGSNRNILIEATINSTGTLRNTATISGDNNDPGKMTNDTSTAVILIDQCVVQPPVIASSASEICRGAMVTLQATGCAGGTVRWSDGQTGLSVSVSPTATTIYSATCIVGRCVSAASNPITIQVNDPQTPTITASAASVCAGSSVTLTASACAGGTIQWSTGQTEASIVVTPTVRTTYTAQCRVGTCLSQSATQIIEITPTLVAPTIASTATEVCPGESVTLTAGGCLGTPVWSTGATGASIVVRPTNSNNSYTVSCQSGACTSPASAPVVINVVSPTIPTVTASVDSICAGGQVVLTATNCNGTLVWNTGATGASITVKPTATTSYYAQCRVRTCLSEASPSVPVTVLTPSAPIISANKTFICSGEAITLSAQGCTGTVKWSGVNLTGSTITFMPTETKEYYATCQLATCTSDVSNRIRVTVNTAGTAPRITASTTATCDGGVVSLSATGCNGTVIWSDGQTGPVVSVTATASVHQFYAVCKVGTQCGSGQSNVIDINVTPLPAPTVVASTSVTCGKDPVTLSVSNCAGTPVWSTGETTSSITVTPGATTTYSVYCQVGACRSATAGTYTITVVPVAAPTIAASATSVAPGGTVTLTATGCNGTVVWSANGINGSNTGTSIVVQPTGTQTYYAQCRVGTCLSDPSTSITVTTNTDCTVSAGTLVAVSPTVCADSNSTTVAARANGGLVQPAGYSVLYILTKGASKVVEQTSATPSFNVPAQSAGYTIHTLVYNANASDKNYLDVSAIRPGLSTAQDVSLLISSRNLCAAFDGTGAAVNVRHVEPPRLVAGPSLTVCYGTTATLEALGCDGGIVTWSDGTVGAKITKVVTSDLWLMATCTIDGCTSEESASIDVILGTPGTPTVAVSKPSVCPGETVVLTATGCDMGSYIWSDGSTGNTLTAAPTATTQYRVKCKVAGCEGDWSPYSTITVGSPAPPTITVSGVTGSGSSVTACFGAPITLTAQGCGPGSYVTWSNDLVGNSITISLAKSGTYTARCCSSDFCKSEASNPITITVLPKVATPTVADRTNICPATTVNLVSGVTSKVSTAGGVFEYYTNASLSADSKVANPATVGTGTYYVVERTVNGCYGLPAMIHVLIKSCETPIACDPTSPATANAGADATICAAKTYQLNGVIGGANAVAHWTTSGTGTFSNPFSANPIYTASTEDVMVGKVTLTLSVSLNNAACPVAKDDVVLTIGGIKSVPTIAVIGKTTFCYGDSVILQAPAGAAGYLWNSKATTQTIVLKNSGTYSVQLVDANGCTSVKSEDVVLTASLPAEMPVVQNLRNTCPSPTVNLANALSYTAVGHSYEFRVGKTITSPLVIRTDSVGAGTYYVFSRSNAGCVSAPAAVTVSIFNCTADSLTTDLAVTKTVSKTAVQQGEIVTYTIRVTNNGNYTAKNIDVRDVLPKGLELVTESGIGISGGVINKRIDSLRAKQASSFSFNARILSKGRIVNKAEITYCDMRDSNPANDTSSVTVTDLTPYKPSLIGLAKAVTGTPTLVGDSLMRVTYRFVVTNFGDDTLRNVQVTDNLAGVFAPGQVVSTSVAAGCTSANCRTITVNPAYTGAATASMLTSASYLLPGNSQTFSLDVIVRRRAGDTTRTYRNQAVATAMNSVTMVSDQSVSGSSADPDNDGNPNNNSGYTSFTLGAPQIKGPAIALSLAVTNNQKQADNSYLVRFRATVKNVGDVSLFGLTLTDSLSKAFASPVSFTVIGVPKVGTGSNLVANSGFNGSSQPNLLTAASYLSAGEQDTLMFIVRILPNGNNGPFFTSATVTGKTSNGSQTVRDISNDGLVPIMNTASSTAVRFSLPSGLLGVAKSVGTPVAVPGSEGVYDVPYTIRLRNMGSVPLKKVQVVDNLSETFRRGALIVGNQIAVTADSGLRVDPAYTGQGLITKMLIDSMSTLAVGASRDLKFTVRVDVKNADTTVFNNRATATALTPTNEVVQDVSTSGTNPDPDNDLDPRNNNVPTPVTLNYRSLLPRIGVALAVRDTVRQADGSYNVTYQVVVKNYSGVTLRNVMLTDSLEKGFNRQTGAVCKVTNAPVAISTGCTLLLNPRFNGMEDTRLSLDDSTSMLAAGKVDTLIFTVNVLPDGSNSTFWNTVQVTAKAGTVRIRDTSTNGLEPDLNGNGNPSDSNESEPTPLTLQVAPSSLFIPEGFSPNGDGINDVFVIRGAAGLTISLEVFNRWGHMIYKNEDYQNDWDGKPNTGIVVGGDANGVPSGTYYYVIKLSDGRRFVHYMIINR